MRPTSLMLFAAGFGRRMGHLTQTTPKPLIQVSGKALIRHALDLTEHLDFSAIVVNLHYLGQQIEGALADTAVQVSWELPDILETGGGLKKALPLLGADPVITLNTDAIWQDNTALQHLLAHWDAQTMDALLLLVPLDHAVGHTGNGDFLLDPTGRILRAKGEGGFAYVGAQIIKTTLLAEINEQVFSLNLLWDKIIATQRAYGVVYPGIWCDVGSPEGLQLAQEYLDRKSNV
jgi:MurNAc alpha-1-phosphate uridylyltransferase